MRLHGDAGPTQFAVDCMAERLTGARQSRHHRPDGNSDDVSHLAVGQTFELAEHEQLLKAIWQRLHATSDQRGVAGPKQQRLGIALRPLGAMSLLVERIADGFRPAGAPAGTGVANNSEKPRAAVAAGESPKVSE